MRSHFLHLVLFTVIVSTFFAFLLRQGPRSRLRFGLTLGAVMVVLSLALAWVMYPFP